MASQSGQKLALNKNVAEHFYCSIIMLSIVDGGEKLFLANFTLSLSAMSLKGEMVISQNKNRSGYFRRLKVFKRFKYVSRSIFTKNIFIKLNPVF